MSKIADARNSASPQRFDEIMERQTTTERQGEGERQCRHSDRKGYGHKSSVRKRAASRMAR
jgi:hypothetical protein